MTKAKARKFCRREDLGRERYLKKYFHADVNDAALYHLVINIGLVDCDSAAKLIGAAMLNQH
jgi:cytidylate kinase